MHDLIREHAAELAARLPDEVRGVALDRLLSWYVHTTHNARVRRDDRGSLLTISPPVAGVSPLTFDHAADAISWFDQERRGLAAVIRMAHALGRDQVTYLLVELCEGDLSGRDLDLLTELLLLARDSCSRLPDRLPEAFIHNSLGLRYSDQGDDCEKAIGYFERALELFAVVGHQLGQARALGNLAIAHDKLGRFDRAIELTEQSLAIKREIGDQAGEARTLGNLAEIYHQIGRLDEAADAAGKAVRYYRQNGIRRGEGPVLDTLGSIERSRGLYDEALELSARIPAPAPRSRLPLGRSRSTDQPRPHLPSRGNACRGGRCVASRPGHLRPDPRPALRRPGPRRTSPPTHRSRLTARSH